MTVMGTLVGQDATPTPPAMVGGVLEGRWSHLRPPAGCGIVGDTRAWCQSWLRPTSGCDVTGATWRGHCLSQGCLPGVAGQEPPWRGACQHRRVGWDRSAGEQWCWMTIASKVDRECQNWHPPLLDQLDKSRGGTKKKSCLQALHSQRKFLQIPTPLAHAQKSVNLLYMWPRHFFICHLCAGSWSE